MNLACPEHPYHPPSLWKKDLELSSSHSSGLCTALQPMSGAATCDLENEPYNAQQCPALLLVAFLPIPTGLGHWALFVCCWW